MRRREPSVHRHPHLLHYYHLTKPHRPARTTRRTRRVSPAAGCALTPCQLPVQCLRVRRVHRMPWRCIVRTRPCRVVQTPQSAEHLKGRARCRTTLFADASPVHKDGQNAKDRSQYHYVADHRSGRGAVLEDALGVSSSLTADPSSARPSKATTRPPPPGVCRTAVVAHTEPPDGCYSGRHASHSSGRSCCCWTQWTAAGGRFWSSTTLQQPRR